MDEVPSDSGAGDVCASSVPAARHSCDPVNSPSHYTLGGIETRDFIAAKRLNFNRGNIVKYVTRAGHKDPAAEIEDLEKALNYLQHEIAQLKAVR